MSTKIEDILKDIDLFDNACRFLYELQDKYDVHHHYAASPETVLRDDMHAMRDVMAQHLGLEMLVNHRKELDQAASPMMTVTATNDTSAEDRFCPACQKYRRTIGNKCVECGADT